MARPTAHNTSSGDALNQLQRKTRHGRNDKSAQKSKKPIKSNITSKTKSKHQTGQSALEADQDDDEGNSSTIHEPSDPAEEPDVSTLSDAMQFGVGENTPRLTGLLMKDHDMFHGLPALDDMQSEAGAGLDIYASEDDYADVDNVSDSGDFADEEEILRSAEKDLIEEFERTERRHTPDTVALGMNHMAIDEDDDFARQLDIANSLMQSSVDVNLDEDPFLGLAKDDNLYNDMWNEAESAIWRMPETVRGRENSDPNSTQKRVRFEERERSASASSGSEDQDPSEAFPDLFTASDNAMVKQHLVTLDKDLDVGNMNDDAESCYDFEDDDERLAFEVDEESDSENDTSTDDDSTDEGDTTDDESREEQLARLRDRKIAQGRDPNSVHPSTPTMAKRAISMNSTPASSRPTTPRSGGRGPKIGTFKLDPTRAAMISEGKTIKLIPPTKPPERERAFWERAKTASSSVTNTPPGSVSYITMPSPQAADDVPARPLTAKSTLGSMFNGDVDILRDHDISGIAEDLFPAVMTSRQHSFTGTTTTDGSDNEMQDINMQDFLAMDDTDDSESDAAAANTFDHFDQFRGVVGSFRRNQHTARHFSSLASHPGKRASTHEFNALQKGKRGAANIPVTPARKKRVSQDLSLNGSGVRKSMGNPLSASRRQRSRGNSLVNADLLQTLSRNPFD